MAPATLNLSSHPASVSFQKAAGSAHSRSTSAGSVPSEGQSITDLQLQKSLERSPPRTTLYPTNELGLPEYDYPMPFAIESARQLPAGDFPTPLVVKNTFIDTASCLRPSLFEFYAERQIKSCPVSGISLSSGISLPPGLEDMFEPEEMAEKLVAAEAALCGEEDVTTRVTPSAMNFLPSGLFDDAAFNPSTQPFLPPPPQQAPAFDNNWLSPTSPAPFHDAPPAFDGKWQSLGSAAPFATAPFDAHWHSPVSPAPLHAPVFDVDWHSPVSPAPWLPSQPQQPVVFSLAAALSSPLEAVKETQSLGEQLAPPGFSLPAMTRTGDVVPNSEPQLGSPECPTLGSQGHWSGECKPCAFLYTRGCANGLSCPFCHLCDPGEKKRRAKDKRAALRTSARSGY